MERALALERLAAALAHAPRLPKAPELAAIMAKAEVALFFGQSAVPDELVAAGWYLIGVAQAPDGIDRYPIRRRYEAWRIAAHIFDLAIGDPRRTTTEKLRFAFAAQVGYFRGGLQPNALAIHRRSQGWIGGACAEEDGLAALGIGVAFLGMARRRLYDDLSRLEAQIKEREKVIPAEESAYSPYFGLSRLLAATRRLMRFLLKGQRDALTEASKLLRDSASARNPVHSLELRWVSSSILSLIDELSQNSIWNVLPQDVPDATRRAFTHGSPPILALWPPQKEIIAPETGRSLLDRESRRVVLGVPTSGGKTLISQLLAVDHVTRGNGGACFVVPTRSLARELASTLEQRFALFRKQVGFESDELDLVATDLDIMVVTPERLGGMIRSDVTALLDRFSLFIFDEAHAIAEASRGFLLETCIATINLLTQDSTHKLVVMSAAIGNRGHIATWLSPQEPAVVGGSVWRGPRRVHAVYSTDIGWDQCVRAPRKGRKWVFVDKYPLFGTVRLRMSATGEVQSLKTTQPIGERIVKVDANGNFDKNDNGSRNWDSSGTPFYKTLADLAQMLGEAGPVLIVVSTRKEARRFAQVLAEGRAALPELAEIAELVRQRLGEEHPLAKIVGTGVVYHHSGLPSDVLWEVENAIKGGLVRFVVATSGLIDGVNLPVRTVIVAEAPNQDWAVPLSPAQIINAFGRAGRACLESEGWAVLARQAAPDPKEFDRITPDDAQLAIRSSLLEDDALRALAEFESEQRSNADALFECAGSRVADFISFVWSVLALGDNHDVARRSVDEWIGATLAWSQLGADMKARWKALALDVEKRFNSTSLEQRQRWGRASSTLGTAKQLDEMADTVVRQMRANDGVFPDNPDTFIDLLNTTGILTGILRLPEAPHIEFFDRPGRGKTQLGIDLVQLLKDWIHGVRVGGLADVHLSRVIDHEFRHEQMGDFVSGAVAHHLSWVVALVIERVNAILANEAAQVDSLWSDELEVLNPEYAHFIRHGVSKSDALELLRLGIKSRTFAQNVAVALARQLPSEERLSDQLNKLGTRAWRELFSPSRTEYADLLRVVRDPEMRIFSILIEGSEVLVTSDLHGNPS